MHWNISLQTPAFGNLVGSGGGDFIFETDPRPEFLSELSEQLDEQELTLIAQIDALKDEIQSRRKRNLELKKDWRYTVKENLNKPCGSSSPPSRWTQPMRKP
jgi:hypothetical protein